ncbi:MAG: hypothetical protein PF904_00680 [Kiritimatiellae bacterium]|jgi:hypothetical protein|nr:hypothetical protein [Kiritimatiellia bacterium]
MSAFLVGCLNTGHSLYVSPEGDDMAAGTRRAPFRSLHRAQEAARSLTAGMTGDVVVNVAPGDYRLDRPLAFTSADSGSNGWHVVYRSKSGPGKARIIGSRILTGWQPYRDGIWRINLPEQTLFHTLYENGIRVHKARFPDRECILEMPVASGRYLTTVDGTPKQSDKGSSRKKGSGWLIYRQEDAPPVTDVTKMRIHIYPGGKCDWVREVHAVTSIDPQTRRLNFDKDPFHGVGTDARFYLEDELGFLNVPGEFFVDEKAHTLYYMPLGQGHPDKLNISCSVLNRLIQFKGESQEHCVKNVVLDGFELAETDNSPPRPYWAYQGMKDGALVWMNNAEHIEIRNCHLKNGGRTGVMMIGHNVSNRVTGCWIDHMGLNGVSLCNKFLAPGGKERTPGRCMFNRIDNTHISHVGELHTYAECVTIFNVSSNVVDHCQLDNSVRYAITVRGNTGAQYGPPVTTSHPPARGNQFHHISVFRCGQDGGDMGALHCAMLNNPGGGSVNTFDQITVADSQAIPSVQDYGPNGIFLDWPKMSMDQVFKNIHIIRSQGGPIRSNRPDNKDSMQWENVSWESGFCEELMDYDHIGLTPEFPSAFGGAPVRDRKAVKIRRLGGEAVAYNRAVLSWDAVAGCDSVEYIIKRDGKEVGRSTVPQWCADRLKEKTSYRYSVAARCGDFTPFGFERECRVTTPADRTPPHLTGVRMSSDGKWVRVAFDEPVKHLQASLKTNYIFAPELTVTFARQLSLNVVQLSVSDYSKKSDYILRVKNIVDHSAAGNKMTGDHSIPMDKFDATVCYELESMDSDRLIDSSGGGGDAVLKKGAKVEAGLGPYGGPALVLDGMQGFAQAPADLNLGAGDFTLSFWVYPKSQGGVIASKGNGFGSIKQWSLGCGVFRCKNHYFRVEKGAVKNNRWTHLAFVRKGKTGVWYVNAQPSGDTHDLSVIGPLINDRKLRVGRREYEKNPMFFNGRISDLCIFPRALTLKEIRCNSRL